jgi:aspartate carbamoyltransferase catalytic subunit
VLTTRNLLGIRKLDVKDIELILDTAERFREVSSRRVKKTPALRGRIVANLFYTPSIRTRISFERACKALSADLINISSAQTSLGETLTDIARTLQAMGVDILVVRHRLAGAPVQLARNISARVINAGDGAHEHPTQALVDAFTIRRIKGRLEGLKVALLGDIRHSPTAKSNLYCLRKLGARVVVGAPSPLIPEGLDELGCKVYHTTEEAVDGADVIILTRVSLDYGNDKLLPSLREYSRFFSLNTERLALAKPDVTVLHGGRINRGVEISAEVAERAWQSMMKEVSAGIVVRMAVLYLLTVGGKGADDEA